MKSLWHVSGAHLEELSDKRRRKRVTRFRKRCQRIGSLQDFNSPLGPIIEVTQEIV
jgi:hypothetical protein